MGTLELQMFQSEVQTADRYDQGFEAGYAKGLEEAHLAAETATKDAIESLTQTLSDLVFKSAEIRHLLVADFNKVVSQICENLLPSLIDPACAAQIFASVYDAGSATKHGTIHVKVGEAFRPDLVELLNGATNGISITRAPDVRSGEALVTTSTSETFIDSADVIDRLIDALSGFSETPQSKASA